MKILVSSRSDAALRTIQGQINRCGAYDPQCVLMVNGHVDPLANVDYRPDVVILHAGEHSTRELQALAERPGVDRPPLIVIGDHLPKDAMKFAMRAGARDIIGENDCDELREALRRLDAERVASEPEGRAQTVVVINAKGGSGATFIATSLATLSASHAGRDTVVVDLDFQYGSLPHYLDVVPRRGLLDALGCAEELDEKAVEAYTVKHDSGVHVLAPLPESQIAVDFNVADRMQTLLLILQKRYDRVIIDLPRHLDDVAARVLQGADNVLLVLQQSLLSVHDAVRLKTVLIRELGIDESRIDCIVNRHSKNGTLSLADLRSALDEDDPVLIPNQFSQVSQALEVGVPVIEQAPNSAVTKSLVGLHGRIMGMPVSESRGFLAKTVFRLRG